MELSFFSPLLFAVSASADSLAAGLSYGVRQIRIPWHINLLLALTGAAGTALPMIFGQAARRLLSSGAAGVLGGLLMAFIGLFSLFPRRAGGESPPPSRLLSSLRPRAALLLGLALSLNNAGLGMGASISGLPMLPTVAYTLGTSLLFLAFGNRLGCSRLSGPVGRAAEPLAGVLMIVLGLGSAFF